MRVTEAETDIDAQGAPATHASAAHAEHPSPKEYVRIGMILGLLTAFEVATYYVDVGPLLVPTLFGLAIVKFTLVVMWFMHLRFDSPTYARFFLMGLAGAATLYLIVLITFRVFLVE